MPKQKSDVEKKGVSKVRQYSIDYLKYGFTEECGNETNHFVCYAAALFVMIQ